MLVGIPKEIKKSEFRVAAIPAGVKALCETGHKVFVERRAGEGSGFSDEGQILFSYLHLAADKNLTQVLLRSKIVGIAYETVQKDDGYLPLLAPMSEIAGRVAPLVGSFYLTKYTGGSGKFIGGVPGVPPPKVMIIGGGEGGS